MCACVSTKAQDFQQSYNFINTGTNGPGSSFANTGITSFFISWSPQTTLLSCAVQVDSSADGVSWGNGDLISSQNCATVGSSGTPQSLGSGKNFVRIHVTALTGNGGLNVSLKGWGGGGSQVTSPSSLSAFFNQYQGLSPLDCGNAACTTQDLTAGNGRSTQDGVLNNTTTVTSATIGFCNGSSVACSGLESNGQPKTSDVGRQFEVACGTTSSQGALTIVSVQSATSATLSGATSVCSGTGNQIFVGSDNTTTLQNWVANGLQNHFVHSYYLPKGVYYTTKPLRFVNPNAVNECGGTVNPSSNFVYCGFNLLGSGAGQSIIHPATQPNFLWSTGSSSNNGVIFISTFSFGMIQGIAVIGDQAHYASTGMAGGSTLGALNLASAQHFFINENWLNAVFISDANVSNRAGLIDAGCFECWISNNAIESNGADAEVSINLAEKETYDNNYLENASNDQTGNALLLNGSNVKQALLRNFHFKGPNNNSAAVQFQPGFTIATGYSVEFDGGRMDQGGATDVGVWVRACTGGTIEFNNFDFVNTGNASAISLLRVDNGPTTCPIVINNGVMSPGGASSRAVLNNGTGGVWMQGVNCLNSCTLAGTGTTNQFIQTATGWGGLGGVTGTYFLSDQAAACTNGELGLSAGWQSTGSATVTAVAGKGQTCSWTITTGTTTAANPTVTDTFVAALPDATTVCELNIHGGTHTAVAGEGFNQTTISATAPVFTANFTPTAGGTTYFVTRRCGP